MSQKRINQLIQNQNKTDEDYPWKQQEIKQPNDRFQHIENDQLIPKIVVNHVQDHQSVDDQHNLQGLTNSQNQFNKIGLIQNHEIKSVHNDDQTSTKQKQEKQFPHNMEQAKQNIQPMQQKTEQNYFQVVVHQINSSQSLEQQQQKPYQIIFTKSQLQIPLKYEGQQQQPKNQQEQINQRQKLYNKQENYDDNFYVQYLQDKWNKDQNNLIQNLSNAFDQKKQLILNQMHSIAEQFKDIIIKQPVRKSNKPQTNNLKVNKIDHILLGQDNKQKAKNTNSMNKLVQNNLVPNKQQTVSVKQKYVPKKTNFKVKKLNDHNLSSSNIRSLKTSNQSRNHKLYKNNSQLIDQSQSKIQKPFGYIRSNKKHLSNFATANNSVDRKQKIKLKSIQKIQYEISISNSVEMMSHILEDKCYNNLQNKNFQNKRVSDNGQNKTIQQQNLNTKEQNPHIVRKIIKRSPYGILQIQVKDKKSNAKITNLRILKPKQLIRLKKIPNIIRSSNKENIKSDNQNTIGEKFSIHQQYQKLINKNHIFK